ncbi:MAG TPA: O-antigen ligase family protein [Blastocatellia bacterium]|nr:O-antigen ligase family protein [Blastocatellia bacterium]
MIEFDARLGPPSVASEAVRSRSPWWAFLFLFIIFAFASPYELGYTVDDHDLDQAVESTAEGTPGRQLALPLLGAFGLCSILINRRHRLSINGWPGLTFAAFLTVVFLSLFWAEEISVTAKKLSVFGLVLVGALGFAVRFTLRELVVFSAFMGYGAIALALGTELAQGTFGQAPAYSAYQFAGIMHPNSMGTYCAIAGLASLTLAHLEPARRKRYLLLAGVGFGFLLLTKSRTSFGCTATVLLVYWLLTTDFKHKFFTLLGLGILACALGFFFSEDLSARLTSLFLLGREGEDNAGSLSNRLPLWQDLLGYIFRHPWLGYGFDSFWTPAHVYAISKRQGWEVPHSHNGYLEITLGLGLLGLVAYLAMLAAHLKTSFTSWLVLRDPCGLYGLMMILWMCLAMTTEKVYMSPIFPTFICNLLIARAAIVNTGEANLSIKSLTFQPAGPPTLRQPEEHSWNYRENR